jgi:tellurite resistance protein
MTRVAVPPPVFPLGRPVKPGLFRRTPPLVFPAILSLLALGLAWRGAVTEFGLPPGVVEAYLGAVTLLWAGAMAAYGGKVLRRGAVIREELRILPGRDGLAGLAMTVPAAALALLPYLPKAAAVLTVAALLVHAYLIVVSALAMRAGPEEGRVVTPVWQTMFTGFLLTALPALELGWVTLARGLFLLAMPVALYIWAVSLWQLIRRIPPAPLRPLLALHMVPAVLLGAVALGLGLPGLAQVFAALATGLLAVLVLSGAWLLRSGFSPLWAAFGFPLTGCAALMLALPGRWHGAGAILLVLVTLAVLPIALKVLQDWAKGGLAARTNAATA